MHGHFNEDALEAYSFLISDLKGYDFSEEGETYDFARCIRPDGSAYGTSGKCRKGTEGGPAEKKVGTGERGARAAAGEGAIKANRQAQAGAADAAKRAEKTAAKKNGPHNAQLKEINAAIKDRLPDLRQRKAELDRLDRALRAHEKVTKKDPSKENKARLKEMIRQANDQERSYNRLGREIDKMTKQYHSLNKRNQRAMMNPAQLKEARRIDAIIRQRG